MRRYLILLILFVAFTACQDSVNNYNDPPESAIRNAPDSVSISGTTYKLSSYLYRDFMPMVNPGTNGLIAVAYVETANHTPIDNSLSLTRIYIVKRNLIWESPFSSFESANENYKTGAVMRNGPTWDTGIYVDVVVGFMLKGNEYFVKVTNQVINRTD
jgi:hypothetical protein